MSSSSTCNTTNDNSTHQLPTTAIFLPVLDDLLSPDFRPVTYPPVITPLQTPTTVQPTSAAASAAARINGAQVVKNETVAAAKIQKWWKSRGQTSSLSVDGRDEQTTESVRHSVRHRRAEEHIRALESEVTRLKSSLATERKLRSLQYEAIRSLWSQVQKLTVNNPGSPTAIMTQSLPNGLNPVVQTESPLHNTTKQPHCACAANMNGIVQKLEDEIAELRNLILQSVVGKEEERSTMESSTSSGSTKVNKRPDSLDLNGGSKAGAQNTANKEELQGYAHEMAKFVVERGISDNVGGGGDAVGK